MKRSTALFVAGMVLLFWIIGALAPILWFEDWPERGQFGDQFGAINALFSGLAFAGVIYAVLLQRQELELQRRELELTRDELRRAAEAQDRSQAALANQATSAARSVAIVYRQWKAERLATLVPLQICLDEVSAATARMQQDLQDVLGKQSQGFGSVNLQEPNLSDARDRARGISRELFDGDSSGSERDSIGSAPLEQATRRSHAVRLVARSTRAP